MKGLIELLRFYKRFNQKIDAIGKLTGGEFLFDEADELRKVIEFTVHDMGGLFEDRGGELYNWVTDDAVDALLEDTENEKLYVDPKTQENVKYTYVYKLEDLLQEWGFKQHDYIEFLNDDELSEEESKRVEFENK